MPKRKRKYRSFLLITTILVGCGALASQVNPHLNAFASTSSSAVTLGQYEDGVRVDTLGTTSVGSTVNVPNSVVTDGVTYFLGTGQADIGTTTDNGDGTSSVLISSNYDTSHGFDPVWYDKVSLNLGSASTVTINVGDTFTPETLESVTGTNGLSGLYDLSASSITVDDSSLDTSQAGTYTVTYTAQITGSASGQSVTTTATQTVIVEDSGTTPTTDPATDPATDPTTNDTNPITVTKNYAMNYHLVDESGNLLTFDGNFGGSFTSNLAGSAAQSEQITQGALTLNGALGDTFPTLTAPLVPDYTLVSGPTLNDGGSYSPSATTPNSTATYTYYQNAQHTTEAVDQNGNALDTPVTSNGSDGATYQSNAPTISGYTLQSTQGTTTGTYDHTAGDTTTTFVYTNGSTVTEHFIDSQTNQEIQSPQVLSGSQNQSFNLTAPVLAGYRLNTKTTGLSGTYQATNQDIDLYYDKQSTVTINLLDGTTVLQSHVLTGYSGDSYSYVLPAISNYTTPTIGTETGKYTNAAQVINVQYRTQTGSVTTNFLDSISGLAIQSPQTQTGNVPDPFQLTPLTINGYRFNPNTSGALTGKYSTTNQQVNLEYDKQTTVTINLVDGPKVLQTNTLTGYAGETYRFALPTLPLYAAPASAFCAGTYTDNNQVINIPYGQLTGTVTVNYLDAQTKQTIQAPTNMIGADGSSYQVTPLTLSGYRLNTTLTNASLETGKYTAGNIAVNLYYDKQSSVTINLPNGESIPLIGYSGETFAQYLPTIMGYQPPAEAQMSGVFTNGSQIIDASTYYVPAVGVLTLNYANSQTGTSLLPSEQYMNNIGDWSVIHIPNIPNYTYLDTGVEVAFQQLLPNESRTLYYAPNLEKIKVDFEDENGQTIAPSQIISDFYGATQVVKAPSIHGYQVNPATPSSFKVEFNQDAQNLIFKYVPQKESITFKFVNDAGQQVYKNETISGNYGDDYSYKPAIPWFDSLTYASQKDITGVYKQPKTTITVHYTRRQSTIVVIDKDDRGNLLRRYTLRGYEGNSYRAISPSYSNLILANSAQHILSGTYNKPNQTIPVLYKHFKTSVTFIYYGTNGARLGSNKISGWCGTTYSYSVPSRFGYYYLNGGTHYSGTYKNYNQTVNVSYYYNPPVIHTTSHGSGRGSGSHSSSGKSGAGGSSSSSGGFNPDAYGGVFNPQGADLSNITDDVRIGLSSDKLYKIIEDALLSKIETVTTKKFAQMVVDKFSSTIDLYWVAQEISSNMDYYVNTVVALMQKNPGVAVVKAIADTYVNNFIRPYGVSLSGRFAAYSGWLGLTTGGPWLGVALAAIAFAIGVAIAFLLIAIIDKAINYLIDKIAKALRLE